MKLNKLLGLAAATSFAATMAMAGVSTMDMAAKYEKECQGCHGPIHQGGVDYGRYT
jgi:nitrite reductase (NO-forming)/hydroxylamine reductase